LYLEKYFSNAEHCPFYGTVVCGIIQVPFMKNIHALDNVTHQFTRYEQYACNPKRQCITVLVGVKGEEKYD